MRKALAIAVFLGLAFIAGTAYNRPAPPWVKAIVRAGWQGGPELITTDTDQIKKVPRGDSTGGGIIPAAPVPPLVVEGGRLPGSTLSTTQAENEGKNSPSTAHTAESPRVATTEGRRSLSEPPTLAAPDQHDGGVTEDHHSETVRKKRQNQWGDLPGSGPAVAPKVLARSDAKTDSELVLAREDEAPSSQLPTDKPVLKTLNADQKNQSLNETSGSWSELQERMQKLGVSRFWVEGEPEGTARFRCIIRISGERAVSQHFEAEGVDVLHAADAALLRVELWRSTEGP